MVAIARRVGAVYKVAVPFVSDDVERHTMSTGFEVLINCRGQDVKLRSTKRDGAAHTESACRVVSASHDTLMLLQPAGTSIKTWKEDWKPDVDSLLYFWHERWFNVVELWNADASLKGFYCNIITPARVVDNELRWDDLDLDLWVQPDGVYRILDEDEWTHNIAHLGYAPELVTCARRAMDELIASVARRAFPFDAIEYVQLERCVA